MRFRFRSIVLFLSLLTAPFSTSGETRADDGAWVDTYRDVSARIIGDALSSTFAWDGWR
jgi:hypothetical protein